MSYRAFTLSLFLILFSVSDSVYAKKRFTLPIRFDYSAELQGGFDQRSFVTEPQEIFVDKYGLISSAGFVSLSADLKWSLGKFRLVARPMSLKNESKPKTDFKELFVVWVPSGDSSIAFGRQKYEWGPTEFYNVSNPFVMLNPHESFFRTFTISPLIAKVSQSFHKSWNFTLLTNLENDNDGAYVAKLENASTRGNFIFGTTYGKGKITPQFMGLYGRWSNSSGFSIYTDSKQSAGSAIYYPVDKAVEGGGIPSVELQDQYFNSKKNFIMSVLGLRWEVKWDFRLEYLYNGAGYDKQQMELFPLAFYPTNPYVTANSTILTQLRMPFLRQHYLYFSTRSPFFGPQKKYQINFNLIENQDDYSLLFNTKLEREIGTSGSLILSMTQSHGNPINGEYSNYLKNYYSCVLKWMY